MGDAAGVVVELFPDRLIQPHLVQQLRVPFRRNTALAPPGFDRIARHQPDEHERDEHQRDKCRDGQRQASEEKAEHEALSTAPK